MKYVDYEYIPEMVRQMKVVFPGIVICADSLADIRRSMQEACGAIDFLSLYGDIDTEKMTEIITLELAKKLAIKSVLHEGSLFTAVTGYDIAGAIDNADVFSYMQNKPEETPHPEWKRVDGKLVCGDTGEEQE